MTDTGLDFDRFLREGLDASGTVRAPESLITSSLQRTAAMPQRPVVVAALDRRTWPAQTHTLSDPGTWRMLRLSVALLITIGLLGAAALIGSRLLDPVPTWPYRGELTTAASLAGRVEEPIVVALDRRRVLVTGWDMGDATTLAEVVDLENGTSTAIGTSGSTSVSSAALLRDGRVAMLAWRSIGDGPDGTSALLVVDPARATVDAWVTLAEPRFMAGMAVLHDGRVLLAGGMDSPETAKVLGTAEIVDLHSGKSTPTGPLVRRRDTPVMTTMADGSVLVTGSAGGLLGATEDQVEFELFDPVGGVFTTGGRLPGPAGAPAPIQIRDGRVLIFGIQDKQLCGRHGIDRIAAYLFNPATGDVQPAPDIPHEVAAAALLADGTVLATGTWQASGKGGGGCSAEGSEAYVIDPWLGVIDPVTGDARLSADPYTGQSTLPGDPDVSLGAIAVLPDGRAVLATWDATGAVDPAPATEILVFD